MFRNREDAARQLAMTLYGRDLHRPLILAIPRGGVATGAVLAQELGAELDVVLARKLRAPQSPEFALGAVSEDGHVYLNPDARRVWGVSDEDIADERRYQLQEIARRKQLFRSVRPQAIVGDRTVIVTDDGIATGSTMIAALHSVRALKPRELIVAVPVAAPDRLLEVQQRCDEVVCLHAPESFNAVGQFYEDFTQVTDDQAVELLRLWATPSEIQHPA